METLLASLAKVIHFGWFSSTVHRRSNRSELSVPMKSDVTSNQCVGWGDNVHYLLWLVGKVFPFSLQTLQHKGNQLSDVGDLSTSS